MKNTYEHIEKGLIKSYSVIVVAVLALVLSPLIIKLILTEDEEVQNTEKEVPVVSTDDVVDNIHVQTGLIADNGYKLVISNCTGCHSSKLVIQNRASREGWLSMIRWMQKTQKLWDLGTNETAILDYLAKNYAPEDKGRRAPLSNIEWYELK